MASLNLYLLGAPRIECDGVPMEVDTRKAIALMAYLAITGTPHTRDTLATLLWPDYEQTNARAALRRTLSALNKALGLANLEIDREMVGPPAGGVLWVDTQRFEHLLRACKFHGHPATQVCADCLPNLEEAVNLYRDDFMAGFSLRDSPTFDDWQFFQSETLRRELAEALDKLVCGYRQQKAYETAIAAARRWLALDLLNEEAHRQLMQLYAWSGQRNAALRQYRECVRILDQELGVPPLDETTQLYEAIKEQRIQPDEPPELVAVETRSLSTKPQAIPIQSQAERDDQPLVELSSESPARANPPLIGRAKEWKTLLEVYSQKARRGHWLVIQGEAGIGKTRLAEEFLDYLRKKGASILTARCYEGESGLAYGPIIKALSAALIAPDAGSRMHGLAPHWLAETGRLLPDLQSLVPALPPVVKVEGPGAQAHFFEGLRQVLLNVAGGPAPGCLFVDDLQWADQASLDFLTYMVRRLGDAPILILTTWREVSEAGGLSIQTRLFEARRAGTATEVDLTRFNAADIDELVQAFQPVEEALPENFTQRLYQESEGLPFFAIAYLESFLKPTPGAFLDWMMPLSVRDLLHTRLAAAGQAENQLLSTAAVIGRSFDFNTLRECSGRSEMEVVSGLESLLAQGLIKENQNSRNGGQITYDFSHEKLRSLVYDEISLPRQRLLHRRVAETLVGANRAVEPGPLAGQVAYHYQQAGQESQAAEYYRLAGEHARRLYAHVEAVAHFQAALALGYPQTAELREAIGDLQTLLGEYSAARASYETAAAHGSPENLARLEYKLGEVHQRQGEWEAAASHFSASLEALGQNGEAPLRARVYAAWSRTAYQESDTENALHLAHQGLELAETANDPQAQAQALNILGILARSAGKADQAREFLEKSLDLASSLPTLDASQAGRIAALNNLALVYSEQGDPKQALLLTQTALELCAQIGDRHREAALHNNLADLYHATGQPEKAMEHLKKAVIIFAEIGVDAGDLKPEIWKLTEW